MPEEIMTLLARLLLLFAVFIAAAHAQTSTKERLNK
jgi:hypothetical protein